MSGVDELPVPLFSNKTPEFPNARGCARAEVRDIKPVRFAKLNVDENSAPAANSDAFFSVSRATLWSGNPKQSPNPRRCAGRLPGPDGTGSRL
jgi:hypothetical protein